MSETLEIFRLLATGFAILPLATVGFAIARVFCTLIESVSKNPSAYKQTFTLGMIGFAATEAVAMFVLVIALLILFH